MTRKRGFREKTTRLTQARVDILWEQAQKRVKEGHFDTARSNVLSARRIAQKTRTKLPRDISRRVCKSCGTVFVPGSNCRVRLRHNRSRHMTVTCLNCGKTKRYYIKSGSQA